MTRLQELAAEIICRRRKVPTERSLLVGISGIDASGKGFIAKKLVDELASSGYNCALIGVDGWLNLPMVRFNEIEPGKHFYENALRLNEMFETLVLPLKTSRSVDVTADLTEERASAHNSYHYHFEDIDIVVLEGIFIFRRALVRHFDLKIWIDCPFEKALERAVIRRQEGLSAKETIHVYHQIYFPAQVTHFELDGPELAADIVLPNV